MSNELDIRSYLRRWLNLILPNILNDLIRIFVSTENHFENKLKDSSLCLFFKCKQRNFINKNEIAMKHLARSIWRFSAFGEYHSHRTPITSPLKFLYNGLKHDGIRRISIWRHCELDISLVSFGWDEWNHTAEVK